MNTKLDFTTEEMNRIEIAMGLMKKIVHGIAKGYDYLDADAIEGEVGLYIMTMIKSYNPAINDSFESYATMCIRGRVIDLKKKSKYLNYTHKYCVNDTNTNDEGDEYSLIDDAATVPDVADTYIEKLDKQAFNEAADEAMRDIYSGATENQLKIVKLYLSGMTVTEIAKALKFNHHMKVTRELKKLRKVIKMNPFAV